MNRLTERTTDGMAYTTIPLNESNIGFKCYTGTIAERLAAYEDTELTPEEFTDLQVCLEDEGDVGGTIGDLIELMQYRKSEAEGRLIKLPCKVGDTVYKLENYGEWNGHEVFMPIKCEMDLIFVGNDNKAYCDLTSIDETLQTGEKFEEVALGEIYLTQEEAEKEMEGKNNE